MKKTYIIAEAGVNHNGSLDMAKELIDVAAQSGADAVKFQTFKAEKVVSQQAPKADYQKMNTAHSESQFDMLHKLELNKENHHVLLEYCQQKNIQFMSTPFDLDSVDLLVQDLNLPRLKLASGEIMNAPLLLKAAKAEKPIILSTGMCTLGEVENALGVLAFGYLQEKKRPSIKAFHESFCSEKGQHILQKMVTLLHCTTEYPASFESVNLQVMDTLRSAFGLSVGLSDHTQGIAIPIAAVAKGATVIEKHFTLNKTLPGPDHTASLEPNEMKAMIEGIRAVEKALGSPVKVPHHTEVQNKSVVRKSLVAAVPISKGDLFDETNLTTKRPGTGIAPQYYWEWLGKKAQRNYTVDEKIDP